MEQKNSAVSIVTVKNKIPLYKGDETNYPDGTSYVEVKSFKYELEYRI